MFYRTVLLRLMWTTHDIVKYVARVLFFPPSFFPSKSCDASISTHVMFRSRIYCRCILGLVEVIETVHIRTHKDVCFLNCLAVFLNLLRAVCWA